jgi:hypothetical protein
MERVDPSEIASELPAWLGWHNEVDIERRCVSIEQHLDVLSSTRWSNTP